MTTDRGSPPPAHAAGTEIRGFRLERVEAVREVRATAYLAVHLATGARVLHLHSPDAENLFSVTFRTPPSDSTGVAHILEHSVLAGSKRYPVKDAFNELSKGSLRTYLNAFTAFDFTSYPVASRVRADFYNLASVYTDLVLNPLLDRSTFMREGHHLEVKEDGRLHVSGIVYNEMKGSFSSPEQVSERTTLRGLFPDTPYGVESGGKPECIPDLTYEAFCAFHRRFYSPSNAFFFFYGNIPTEDHLAFLADQLHGMARVEVDSAVPDQPRWSAPREIEAFFPIGPEDPEAHRATVNLAWLTAGVGDIGDRVVLQVLEEALIGNAAGPLRKGLIDSGLGQDLSPASGLHTWLREFPFVVGLRGTDADSKDAIIELTRSILSRIDAEGLSPDLLQAACHQVEFKGLEITRSPSVFPVTLLTRALETWLHGGDPLLPLRFPTLMADLRERWAKDPDLFRRTMRNWLIDNPHRLCAVIAPSRTLSQEQEARLEERLRRVRAAMSEEDVDRIRGEAESLTEGHRAKDSAAALASLPNLRLEQIPREIEVVPTADRVRDGVRVLEHDVFSNGIGYLDLAFDVSHVPESLQLYLPLLGAAFCGMGAAGQDYEEFATRKALHTGGVFPELRARNLHGQQGCVQFLALRSRALARNLPEMVAILRDIVLAGDLADAGRLRDILAEKRNSLRAQVAPSGHAFGPRSAAATLSQAAHRDEQWHGATQIVFLNTLARQLEEEPASLCAKLAELRDLVFGRGKVILNVTGDEQSLAVLRGALPGLIGALPFRSAPWEPAAPGDPDGAWPRPADSPGFAIPGKVCYVARVLSVPRQSDPDAPSIAVLAHHLADGVLYKKIRVEGGAYGGFSTYNPNLGLFSLMSYRDPNLEKTLDVYDRCLEEFLRAEPDSETVRKGVIGTIGDLDRPMDPATQGFIAMERWLIGLSDAARQRYRDDVLAVDARAMQFGVREILRPAMEKARQAVYAPKFRIEAANETVRPPFEIKVLD